MHAVAAAGSGLVCHEWRATAVRRWGVPAPPRGASDHEGQSAQQDARVVRSTGRRPALSPDRVSMRPHCFVNKREMESKEHVESTLAHLRHGSTYKGGPRRPPRPETPLYRHFVTEIHTHGLAVSGGKTERETRRKSQPA